MGIERRYHKEGGVVADPQNHRTLERLASDVAEIRKLMFGFWWLGWLSFGLFILAAVDII